MLDKPEKAEAIIKKVRDLRVPQKEFFAGNKSVLPECKQPEKEIDVAIAEWKLISGLKLFSMIKSWLLRLLCSHSYTTTVATWVGPDDQFRVMKVKCNCCGKRWKEEYR